MRRFSQHAGARYNEIGCLTISNRKVRGLTSVNPAAWVPEAFFPQALAGKNRRSPFTREHGIFARASSLEPVSLVAILKRDFIHSVQSKLSQQNFSCGGLEDVGVFAFRDQNSVSKSRRRTGCLDCLGFGQTQLAFPCYCFAVQDRDIPAN